MTQKKIVTAFDLEFDDANLQNFYGQMMSIKDLMFGDWVDAEGYGQVKGIIIDEEDHCPQALIRDDIWYPLDLVKPIPLTPEILEKNGFNYEETHDVWILEYGEIIIEVGAYHPDFINVSYKQMTPDGIIEGDISSISKVDGSDIMTHELQHALRLCGIDKEIEL